MEKVTSPCFNPAGTPQSTTEREEVRPLSYHFFLPFAATRVSIFPRSASYTLHPTPGRNTIFYLTGTIHISGISTFGISPFTVLLYGQLTCPGVKLRAGAALMRIMGTKVYPPAIALLTSSLFCNPLCFHCPGMKPTAQ